MPCRELYAGWCCRSTAAVADASALGTANAIELALRVDA